MNTDTIIPTWNLGDRLRKAREEAGIGVQEMADELEVTRNTITRYERRSEQAKRKVPRSQVRIWAQVTGVELEWLETGEGSRSRCNSPGQLQLDIERRAA